MSTHWTWIWPSVGPTPVNQGLDSEMFDRDDYPYSETFVREAIQNSLDARADNREPVLIRFEFHKGKLGKRRRLLEDAILHRREAGLPVPAEWDNDQIRWITVQDSNTNGLLGDLDDRKGDFWGYWLNFGLSNKSGRGRGGRGIGRVTFLIASRLHTVLGLTKRATDSVIAGCGMCVLRADMFQGEFKSTHAYLAADTNQFIYELHNSEQFHREMEEAWELWRYTDAGSETGLSLVIPYPYEELTESKILAAAVDHFAPAILSGALVVEVGVDRLDQESIKRVAPCVTEDMSKAISVGVERYLDMIEAGLMGSVDVLSLPRPTAPIADQRETEVAVNLRSNLLAGQAIVFDLAFPMKRNGRANQVSITAVAAPTPYGKPPIDRLFREGMSLPDVKTRRPVDLDLILLVEEEPLAQYLNFCEGKAHLDLLGSTEVKTKLANEGFEDGLSVRRLVKALADDLRSLLTEESEEPDAAVWENWFSIPDESGKKPITPKPKKEEPPVPPIPPPVPPPPANVTAVIVDTLEDGFRLRPNSEYRKFPASVIVDIAYADGSAKPSWSPFDFRPRDLKTVSENCEVEFVDNVLKVENWSESSLIEVTRFDTRRELDTHIRTKSNASED